MSELDEARERYKVYLSKIVETIDEETGEVVTQYPAVYPGLFADEELLARAACEAGDAKDALLRLGRAVLAGGPPDDIGPPPEVTEEYYAASDAVKFLSVKMAQAAIDAAREAQS